MQEKNTPNFTVADSEKIVCKNCVYGWFTYYLAGHCAKFKNKPADIYYEGAQCPYFKESKKK